MKGEDGSSFALGWSAVGDVRRVREEIQWDNFTRFKAGVGYIHRAGERKCQS